jgi:hypothetical protein
MREADVNQEVHGLPEYLSALQAAWLNESATLFRRRYYNNGSHAGFILYISDTAQQQADIDSIRQALKESKGPGNFRNLFLYSPNDKKDGVQLIPVSEVAARDDFFSIKNVSRDDVLAAHRVPPQLMGIVPGNTGGFGAVLPAAQVFARNEIKPLQERFREINAWLSMQPAIMGCGRKCPAWAAVRWRAGWLSSHRACWDFHGRRRSRSTWGHFRKRGCCRLAAGPHIMVEAGAGSGARRYDAPWRPSTSRSGSLRPGTSG